MDCGDFEQIMVDSSKAITDLPDRAEAADAWAEKAEGGGNLESKKTAPEGAERSQRLLIHGGKRVG